MNFHPDFLQTAFDATDVTILSSIMPIVADKAAGDSDAFEAGLHEFIALYAAHLVSLPNNDFIVALNKASAVMQARAGEQS